MRERRFLLLSIPLVAGCATYRPSPLEPAAELRALEQQGVGAGREGLGEAELVGLALASNPELAVERARVGEAASMLLAAGVWPNPSLERVWRPGIGHADGHSVEGELLLALPRPGERAAERAAAREGTAAARAELEAREWELVAGVRKARLAVLAAGERRTALEAELALKARTVEHLAARRRAGDGGELPLALAELERDALEREAAELAREAAAARGALRALVGVPPGRELEVAGEGAPVPGEVDGLDPDDAELDRRILEGRPELRALEARYREAEAELKLAVAKQYPRLALGSAFARENDGTKYRGLGFGLDLPVFDRNRGEIAAKRRARDRVRAEFRARLHRLRAEAWAARERLRADRAEATRLEAEVGPRVERLDALVARGLAARVLDFVSAAAARQETLRARRDLVAARIRRAEARIELEAAIGIGGRKGEP